MKGIAGFLIASIVLIGLGTAGLMSSRAERYRADALQNIATERYADASQSLDDASRYVRYGRWLPGIGARAVNELEAAKASLQYWRRDYESLLPEGSDPVAAVEEDNVALQFVVANAAYRQGLVTQAKGTDRAAIVQALEEAASGYLTVLKNSDVNEDAAFNYEYLVRLRDEASRGRRPPPPEDSEQQDGDLGESGAPSEATSQKGFEIYIPLESEERPAGGDAGKAPGKDRKG
jgi:hypothetical protein